MSVDLSLIIPNKCHSIRDKKDARKCFDDTIESITKYFHEHKQFITEIIIHEEETEEESPEYSFEIPLLNITAFMHNGFWDIWPVASYSQYFYAHSRDMFGKPYLWPRNVCFNTLLAFGQRDGYICDEYHSWNSPLDDIDSNFEDWKLYGKSAEDAIVHEFDIKMFVDINFEKPTWPDYEVKYHDNYKECHDILKEVRKRFPKYDIMLVDIPIHGYAFTAKDDELFLLNIETGESLTNFPIDNCRGDFNGAGIQIFKGEESAFFNMKGKQLTEFRKGDFSWEWDRRPCNPFGQIVTDKATDKRFYTDGTPLRNK